MADKVITTKKSLAIIRLYCLAQMMLDDMDELREYPDLYKGNIKPLTRQLNIAIQKQMKDQISRVYSIIGDDTVSIQHSLDQILKFVVEMDGNKVGKSIAQNTVKQG